MKAETQTDPREELKVLEERVMSGDTSVTAAMLGKARQAVELAELHDEAAHRKTHREAEERRQAEQEALRRDVATLQDGLEEMGQRYSRLVSALRSLGDGVEKWKEQRTELLTKARPLDLAGEVEGALPTLDRDWLGLAVDEARGRYVRHPSARLFSGVLDHAVVFHHLHTSAARERIQKEEDERIRAKAIRMEAAAKQEARV